jgi:hypothetical protein
MQPPPSIEQQRAERPDLTDEQLLKREERFRLVQQARMTGFLGELVAPPDHPDDPWEQESELQAWCNLKGSPMTLSTNLGRPRDPNVPMESLAAWCAYHGIPFTERDAAG